MINYKAQTTSDIKLCFVTISILCLEKFHVIVFYVFNGTDSNWKNIYILFYFTSVLSAIKASNFQQGICESCLRVVKYVIVTSSNWKVHAVLKADMVYIILISSGRAY